MSIDWCVAPALRSGCQYFDKHHGGLLRCVHGNLMRDEVIIVTGAYAAQELRDDNGGVEALSAPWHVVLSNIDRPSGELGENRWFFGNFSTKASLGRHKDFYVRFCSQPENKPLEFYEEFPASMAKDAPSPVNTWIKVVPGTTVSAAKAAVLG